MNAIILAAGMGTRMGDMCKDTPKCLLPIAGKPMLGWWIERLLGIGIEQVIFNTHHHAEQVEDYVVEKYTPELASDRLVCSYEKELKGTSRTVFDHSDKLEKDTFLVVLCDVWTPMSLRKLIAWHKVRGANATLGAYKTDEAYRCGVLKIGERQRVLEVREKPEDVEDGFVWSGIAVMEPITLRQNRCGINDIAAHWLKMLVYNLMVYAYVPTEPTIDIGSPERYAIANKEAEKWTN